MIPYVWDYVNRKNLISGNPYRTVHRRMDTFPDGTGLRRVDILDMTKVVV